MSRSNGRRIRAGFVFGVSLALVLAPALPSVIAGPARHALTQEAPSPREDMGMAYDAAHGQVVLFGGVSKRGYRGDTWTWDGTAWTRLGPTHGPSPRSNVAMAYDAARGQVVLFGGLGGPPRYRNRGDTWIWDGVDWTKRAPAHSPLPRWGAAMAYDAARGQVVLFGGGSGGRYRDTWVWDGTDWAQQHPAHEPSKRIRARMAYDATTGLTLLYGGYGHEHVLSDSWTWDGTDWTRLTPTHSPSPSRVGMGMAYDTDTGRVLLFGGGFPCRNDTWTWDGTDWTQLTPAHSPGARWLTDMAYDAARGQIVLFGGDGAHRELGDTWTWDGTDWTQHSVS